MNKKLSYLVVLGTAVVLSGCASFSQQSRHQDTSAMSHSYTPLEIISQESQKAQLATQLLTKYRHTQTSTLNLRQKNFETDKVVIDYIGKPRAILSSIAIQYGYRFIEVGRVRDLPTVNFTSVHSTPYDILVNLDSKLGQDADIAINKKDKTITLIYR